MDSSVEMARRAGLEDGLQAGLVDRELAKLALEEKRKSLVGVDKGDFGNRSGLPWIIQKYGGTSVGKSLSSIVEEIVPQAMETYRVALVCSARSGGTKLTGTTNRLLDAAQEALLKPNTTRFHQIVDLIVQDHLQAAKDAVKDSARLDRLETVLKEEMDRLRNFLAAAQTIDEISPKSKDIIVSVGERLSCMIVVAALQEHGIDACLVSLDDLVGSEYADKTDLDQSFYDHLVLRLFEKVSSAEVLDRVPVVTGFFGTVPGSLLSNIGRGYTDLCAALLAVATGAHELQIWKEVDGIFTADPRKVATARLLPIITPEEASELTYYGSEVIHPFTMEQVIRARIPIRIKNVENPSGQGTVIYPEARLEGEDSPPRWGNIRSSILPSFDHKGVSTPPALPPGFLHANGYYGSGTDISRKRPTAVTIKDGITVLNVHSNRKTISHGFYAKIFGTLDRFGIAVDLISTSEVHISLAIARETRTKDLSRLLAELEHYGTVSILKDMAILSLVGKQMKNMVGIAGKMFTTLAAGNVNIEMISQGASEISISCVVEQSKAVKALCLVHQHLLGVNGLY